MSIRTGLLVAVGLVAIDATALAATNAPTASVLGASLERRAWAALLTGNTENMTTLALVQIASVRRFSKYPTHVTMVTPEVNEIARKQLRAAGSHIVEVGMITPPWQISASWWNTVFTKLQIFSLHNSSSAGVLDKVAFVDLDAFIVSEKADTIFDACGAKELCAVRDAANLCINPTTGDQTVCAMNSPGSSAMINAGVMVARPSASLLASFQEQLGRKNKPYLTLPEQEFLSSIYLKGIEYRQPENFHFISADYGQCWANGQQLATAAIVHNCGPFKYGHHPLCAWDDNREGCLERLLGWSEGPQRAAEVPRQKVLGLYQNLISTANPCAVHGRTEGTCAASTSNPIGGSDFGPQCVWCGEDVRCVPTGTCLPSTPAKTAQVERWNLYLREREWIAQQELLNRRRHLASGGPPLPPGYSAPPMPPGLAGPPGTAPPFMMAGPPPGLMPTLTVVASPPPPVSQSPAAGTPPVATTKSPSPPAMPPATPGTAYAQRVTTQFVLSGTVETFDKEGFRAALLKVFTAAIDITLTVSPASVSVDAQIDFATKDAADSAATTINTTPVAEMQSTWFAGVDITIENTPSASVAIVATPTAAVAAAIAAASNGDGLNAGEVFGFVVLGLLGTCWLVGGTLYVLRKVRSSKINIPGNLKPRKVRVIPGGDALAEGGTQPLVAQGDGAPLAVKDDAIEGQVVSTGVSKVKFAKKSDLKVDIPLAQAGAAGFRVPPLSPQHRAEEKVLEKVAGKGAPGDSSDAISETSNDADSESTAMIPTGGAPSVPSQPAPAPSRPAPAPSRPAPTPSRPAPAPGAKPALPPIGGKDEWPSAMPKNEEEKKEDKE